MLVECCFTSTEAVGLLETGMCACSGFISFIVELVQAQVTCILSEQDIGAVVRSYGRCRFTPLSVLTELV